MAKIQYVAKNFRQNALDLIEKCDSILTSFAEQGFKMTVRQLYYQLVAADYIPNNQKEYNRVKCTVSDARRAGLLDWKLIEDRTRNLKSPPHWDSPGEIIRVAASQYRIDMWADQPFRPEVWIEKDALVGVIERVCDSMQVPYFSCRGYSSDSEMWGAGDRFKSYQRNGQIPLVFHLGDHDPSGIDMTRDISDRLEMFSRSSIEVRRLALNMPQIEEFRPPPNWAKLSDSRAKDYVKRYGLNSWELDALNPERLSNLVDDHIESIIDQVEWAKAEELEQSQRSVLEKIRRTACLICDF